MAVEYSIEHIYKQIKTRGYTWCKIVANGQTKLLLSSFNHEQLTPDEIIKELREYFSDFPGYYRVLLKKKPTDKDTNIVSYERVNVNDFSDSTSQQAEKNNSYQGNDLKKIKDQMKKELLQELVTEKKKDDLAKELAAQKKKTQELDTIAGKALYLLTKFIEGTPIANGVLGTTNTTAMAHEPKPLNTFTDADKKTSNEALMRLLSVTNPDFLLEMSKKIQAKPELIATLKTFL